MTSSGVLPLCMRQAGRARTDLRSYDPRCCPYRRPASELGLTVMLSELAADQELDGATSRLANDTRASVLRWIGLVAAIGLLVRAVADVCT